MWLRLIKTGAQSIASVWHAHVGARSIVSLTTLQGSSTTRAVARALSRSNHTLPIGSCVRVLIADNGSCKLGSNP